MSPSPNDSRVGQCSERRSWRDGDRGKSHLVYQLCRVRCWFNYSAFATGQHLPSGLHQFELDDVKQ